MPPTSDRPPDPLIGQVVDDRYRIIRAIGRGGMGLIYEAQATRLGGRLCAVKVLLPEFAASGTAAARFAREAEVAARVKHPNVIDIFDTGTAASGLRYIAMELLTGEGLDRTLRRGPLPWPRAQHITLQICRALAAAHAAQVVHRDMKPENCFRVTREDDDDFIKVLDFGIAKLIDTEDRDEDSRLTSTGSVIGTYAYMSIEQIDGEPIDHRTDIWAVGVILHELLTGQLPFRGKNQGQVWKAIHEHDLLPMRNLAPQMHIPAPAEAIVAQALARSLSERYPTIEALARAVASVQADGSQRAVTGKLGLPTLPPPTLPAPRRSAPTLASAPTQAAESPRLSQRTDPVSMHGLTELMPEAAVVDTDETALADAPHSTRPEARTELAPARTELAPRARTESALASTPTAPPPRRRAPLLLLALTALPVVALAVFLSQGTGPTEPPRAAPVTAEPAPAPVAAPTPEPTTAPEPKPTPPEPVAPGSTSIPTPEPGPAKATAPKKPESFKARFDRLVRSYPAKVKAEPCVLAKELKVRVDVAAATGAAQLVMPGSSQGLGVEPCLKRALARLKFARGGPGDTDLSAPVVLKP